MEDRIMEIFQETGVLLEGHFQLSSGRHSRRYLQCARVLQYPGYTEELCRLLVQDYRARGVDVVVGPALGGVVIAYEAGRQLGTRGLFAEREEGKMALRRGFQVSPGEKVLVVEDVITTGGSIKEVIQLLQGGGAEVVGAASFVDRSGGVVDLGVPFKGLLKVEIETFSPGDCPLCHQGIPLEKPGSRK